jgi:hypothetical protein
MLKTLRKLLYNALYGIGALVGKLINKTGLFVIGELVLYYLIRDYGWQGMIAYIIQLPIMLEVILRIRKSD